MSFSFPGYLTQTRSIPISTTYEKSSKEKPRVKNSMAREVWVEMLRVLSFATDSLRSNRELKQTDAAAVNRQISIQIQSDGCQGPTEFTWH